MAIAVSHFGFNFIGAIIFIPLIPWASMMLHKVLPGSDRILSDIEIEEFDESLITSMPVVALDMVKRTTLKMGELAIEGIRSSHRFLSEKDPIAQDEVMQLEEIINSIDTKTTAYLLKIAKQDISEELMEEYATNLQVVKNLERISDLSTNLIEYYDLLYENKSSFTEESVEAIDQLYEQLIHMITRSLESYEHNDLTIHNQLIEEEAYMDLLEAQARNRYFARITKNPEIVNVASSVFIDIITTLERMGDHAFNISALTFSPTKLHPPKEMHYQ